MQGTTTAAVDNAFIGIIALCILLFALIIFFTIYFAVRYRRSRNPSPSTVHGNWVLELAWVAAATVVAVGIFFYGLTGFQFLKKIPADSMAVNVTARQWSWLFTYDNGRKSTDLVVPQGRNIALTMQTPDVIHGFFIPAYRIKQDIVPGMKNHTWFRAQNLGAYDIFCTQYCGTEHSKMLAMVYVVAPDIFQKWYNGEEVDIPGLTSE
jgi:cytochrome c oxidase subunit II